MNQKHTPGPWQHASAFVNNAPNVFVVTAGKWGAPNIAQCSNENDARLIAAAPDMLAALELVNVDKDGDGFICAEGMDQVRAAIRKATGAP